LRFPFWVGIFDFVFISGPKLESWYFGTRHQKKEVVEPSVDVKIERNGENGFNGPTSSDKQKKRHPPPGCMSRIGENSAQCQKILQVPTDGTSCPLK